MMVSKMQLLTKGLHALWQVRVFCNGDNSKETIDIKHNLSCYVRYVPRSETVIAPGDSDSNRTRAIAAEFYSLV